MQDGAEYGESRATIIDRLHYEKQKNHELETQNELLRTESNGYQSAAEGHCKRVLELEAECFALAARQCSDPVAGEYGHQLCGKVLELEARNAELHELASHGMDPEKCELRKRVVELEAELRVCNAILAAEGWSI